MVLLAAAPVRTNVPAAVNKLDHVVFCVLDVPPDLLQDSLICPPALKKYLAWFSLANVNVFESVELLFQELVLVLETELSDPSAAALFLFVLTVSMFALNAVNAATVSPVDGFVILVIVEP